MRSLAASSRRIQPLGGHLGLPRRHSAAEDRWIHAVNVHVGTAGSHVLDAHPPLLTQPTQQHILLGCSQDVHSSVCREKCPHSRPTYSGLLWNVSSVCFSAAHQRCLFSSRRSAPMLIVAVHLRGSRHVCVSRPRVLKLALCSATILGFLKKPALAYSGWGLCFQLFSEENPHNCCCFRCAR